MAAKRGRTSDASPTRNKRKASKAKPAARAARKPNKTTGAGVNRDVAKKRAQAELAVPPAPAENTSPTPKATGRRPAKKAAAKNPVGRPPLYRREMCDQIRELAKADGMGKAELAAELGISRQCWSEWAKAHPEFGDAIQDAVFLAQAWYERKGRLGIDKGKDFNAQVWRIQMFNRFPDDYRDKRETKHDLSDDLAGLLRELDGGTGRFRTGA